MKNFYQEDLAYIHHAGFGDFARQAGEQLLRLLRDSIGDKGLVVDLGCGSGIWASMLLEAGYDAAGVDISPHMIELARQVAPGATLQQDSVFEFELPNCHTVHSVGGGPGLWKSGSANRCAAIPTVRKSSCKVAQWRLLSL